jgi:hypothetical protein
VAGRKLTRFYLNLLSNGTNFKETSMTTPPKFTVIQFQLFINLLIEIVIISETLTSKMAQ